MPNRLIALAQKYTEDQTQPATYNIYANPNAMINVAIVPRDDAGTGQPVSRNKHASQSHVRHLIGNEAHILLIIRLDFRRNYITTETPSKPVRQSFARWRDVAVQALGFRDFTFNYNPRRESVRAIVVSA